MLKTAAARLAGLEIWIVSALGLLSMLETDLLLPACLAAAAFWPLRRIATGRWTRRTPLDLPVLVLAVLALLSLAVTAFPELTIPQVWRLLLGIGLFYALVNWVDGPGRLRFLLPGLLAAGVALALFGFVSVNWTQSKLPFIPDRFYEFFTVLVADTVHPNVLAGNLLMFAVLALAGALWDAAGSRLWRLAAAAAFLFMAAVIVLTQTRGALLGLGAAFFILIALRWRWGWLGFAAAGAAGLWLAASLGLGNLLDMFVGSRILGGFQGRTEIWGRAIFILQDFPFTGIGMGSFPEVVDRIYPFFTPDGPQVLHAHNLFLQVGVDLGLPGLLAWLAAFLGIAALSWQSFQYGRQAGRQELQALGAGFFAVQAAIAVHGIFDAVLWGQVRPAPLLWIVWGGAVAVFLAARTRQQPPA